jgi:hypothetical protein
VRGISDSRCWLGLGASIDGETLFKRFAGSGGRFGDGRPLVSGDSGAVWGKCSQRGEVVAAVSGNRQRGGQADGRAPPAPSAWRARVAFGADRGETGPDTAGDVGRAGSARHWHQLRRVVVILGRRGHHVQKKPCTPPSRTGPTSPAGGFGGSSTRVGLTPAAWSSSTRPGPRPI